MDTHVFEVRLSTNLSTTITTSDNSEMFVGKLSKGRWYVDEHGWCVNPKHVVIWREKL